MRELPPSKEIVAHELDGAIKYTPGKIISIHRELANRILAVLRAEAKPSGDASPALDYADAIAERRTAHEPPVRQCNHGAISPKGTLFYHGFVGPANHWRCDVCKGVYEGNLTDPSGVALTLVSSSQPPPADVQMAMALISEVDCHLANAKWDKDATARRKLHQAHGLLALTKEGSPEFLASVGVCPECKTVAGFHQPNCGAKP